MRARITKRTVEAISPADRDAYLWDTETPGFGCKITPAGGRIYLLRYELAGRVRRCRIGRHGADVTADQARKEAQRLRGEIAAGRDPVAERAKRRGDGRLADLAERYMREHAEPHKKASSAVEDRRNIDNHIVPLIGRLAIADVGQADIARLLRAIGAGETARNEKTGKHGRRIVRGGRGAANRTLALLSKMLSLAEAWGLRPGGSNPCRHVERFT